ncbi:MAG: hypothetical protein J6W96_05595 [Alphaproteobacteria bacterium]|nr:hypothetical protein [Alphaproteobacteria bacterium]
MLRYFVMLLLLLIPSTGHTEDVDVPLELQEFEAYSDVLPLDEYGMERGTKRILRQLDIIPYILSEIKEDAAANLSSPEQVFCYHVTRRPADYTGYTLDRFAVTGYCGELDTSEIITTYEALFTKNTNVLTQKSDCRVEPKLMLRFVRGVDYTDVLLSNPCSSITVFYGGRYNSFNIKQGIMTEIIEELQDKNERFYSPALLKQTVANGKPSTTEEEELIEKKQREHQPIMNWQTDTDSSQVSSEAEEEKPATGGWGNLKNWQIKSKN